MSWVIVEHGGRRYRLAVARDANGVWVGYPGGAAFVREQRHLATECLADDRVRAPMTGKVVQVVAAVGDAVGEGDLLVVLESMKIEYRLTAPVAGRVHAVLCAAGDLVDSGAVLVQVVSAAAAGDDTAEVGMLAPVAPTRRPASLRASAAVRADPPPAPPSSARRRSGGRRA